MKEKLSDLLKAVIFDLFDRDDLFLEIIKTKSEAHGDWSSNVAMILAKELQENPKELAKKIISSLPDKEWIEKVELAGPGFINFFLTDLANLNYLKNLLEGEESFYPFQEKIKKNI